MLKHNTIYNISGVLLQSACALITIPVYINYIGAQKYGVMALLWVVLGYFGIFDLGISRSTAYFVARAQHIEERERVVLSGVICSFIFGALAAIAFYLSSNYVADTLFSHANFARSDISVSVPYIAAALPFITLGGVAIGAMEGRERFLLVNSLQVCGGMLFQIAPLAVVFLVGPSLPAMIIAAVVARVLFIFALCIAAKFQVPFYTLRSVTIGHLSAVI